MKAPQLKSIVTCVSLAIISSCTPEDITSNPSSTNFESYSFSNAFYPGQQERLAMTAELSAYAKSAHQEGVSVDFNTMVNMLSNENTVWEGEYFQLQGQPTKDIRTKMFEGEEDVVLQWMEVLDSISLVATAPGESGVAGRVTSLDGTKTYLFDENGFEPAQLIEKGIMANCFYFQGTSVYLSDEKLNTANNDTLVVGKTYTEREHFWDESFGYTGFLDNLSASNYQELRGDMAFYGKYLSKAVDVDPSILTDILNDGFIKGRIAITNNDLESRDQARETIVRSWERIQLASALHYLNGGLDNISDVAIRNHQLSEAYAFIYGLKFNAFATITPSQVQEALEMMGENFYEIAPSNIVDTRNYLASIFSIQNAQDY